MGFIKLGFEFGMGLRGDEVRVIRKFDKFDQVRFGIPSRKMHAVLFEEFVVVRIDFKSVSVSFRNRTVFDILWNIALVQRFYFTSRRESGDVRTESHTCTFIDRF